MARKRPLLLIGFLFLFLIVGSAFFLAYDQWFPPDALDTVLQKGRLTILTRNNAHCYYIYRDQAMGFEFDLAKEFADYLGVRLQVIIASKWEEMIPRLLSGEGQIIAASFTATPKREKRVWFSDAYMSIQQQIIVNRGNTRIRTMKDLVGRKVVVRTGTSYQERLEHLRSLGLDLVVVTMDNVSTGELIQKVARGEIEITIADTNVALLNRRYFPKAVIRESISDAEDLAWAIAPGSKKLLAEINTFFKKIKQNGTYDQIYAKYYTDVDQFDYVDLRTYHRRLKTRLPKYSVIIREAAERYGFDWRIIAAQMYQESHFWRWARSTAGAYGLMQLTRRTARTYGVRNLYDPRQNIVAGVRHLKNLYDLFDGAEGADRLFIALGAYNTGQGHVRDAQRVARKMNLNPNKWTALTKTLPLLSEWEYYKNARYGYCRGTEPVRYVRQIMIYYDILRHQALEYDLMPAPVDQEARM